MKHFSQIAIIAAVSFVGELLHYLIPLPVPGSIYGLVLMLLLLVSGILPLERVKTVGDWLLSLMPVMFVGPVVGLVASFESYRDFLLPLAVIIPLTTLLTMGVTGRTVQRIIGLQAGKEDDSHA